MDTLSFFQRQEIPSLGPSLLIGAGQEVLLLLMTLKF